MPDEAPNPDAAVNETNNSNRAAIIAKSQAALAAAIAEVNKEPAAAKPAAKPEPIAEPVESEPAEEPAEAAEAVQEAKPAEPVAEQPAEKVSASLERKAKRQIQLRQQQRELEQERQARQRLEAELEAAKADRELAALVRQNPLIGIQKAGHDPARVVPDWLAQAAQPEKTPEQLAVEAQQKKLEELQAFQKRVEEQQRVQAVSAQVAAYQQQCSEAIADKAAFEYVHRDGGTPALYEYIVDLFSLAKAQHAAKAISDDQLNYIAKLPPSAFAAQMEKELRGKFGPKAASPAPTTAGAPAATVEPQKVRGRTVDSSYTDAAKNVRGARSIRQRQDQMAKTREAAAEPQTLSARNSGARTVPFRRQLTEKELIENAKRAFETGKPILRQ